MKKLLTILLVFISVQIFATDYYVDADAEGGGDGSISSPYTFAEANSTTFSPGDNVLFQRGDIFYGTLTIGQSGTSGSQITFSAYGTGANPVITGFTTLTSWTDNGSGIYYATLDVPRLNIVTLDGNVVGMGRYPNSGYLNIESHSGNTSITDSQLTGTPDWTGAEIAIRKDRYIIDRHVVTNQSGSTLTYSALYDYGDNQSYSPIDGCGYFFQNDIKCLDGLGDWYYDVSANRLYMYFGESPVSHSIKAGNNAENVVGYSKSYINIENIDFEGANIDGAHIEGGAHISFSNCNFSSQGGNGIYALNSDYITVSGGSITDALNDGMFFEYNTNHCTIDGVSLRNSGMIVGASKSGDGMMQGIYMDGNYNTVRNCDVVNSGYNGITFNRDYALIEYNFVDSFCIVKDDGAGIYTSISDSAIIRNNIVLNAIGSTEGYAGSVVAAGIYIDEGGGNHNATIDSNTVANAPYAGIFIHRNGGNHITNNIVFNCGAQVWIIEGAIGQVRNMVITGNQFISKTATQKTIYNYVTQVADDPSLFGTFDNNYYARPIDDNKTIYTYLQGVITARSLSEQQTYMSQDVNSNKSPFEVASADSIFFAYNYSSSAIDYSLSEPIVELDGTTKHSSTITIQPYSSVVGLVDPNPSPIGYKLIYNSETEKYLPIMVPVY